MYERILELCASRKTNPSRLEKALGFANGSLRKSDPQKIQAWRVKAIADYFDVSMEYVLTGDAKANMTKRILEYAKRLSALPREYQDKIIDQLDYQEFAYNKEIEKKETSLRA